MQVLSQMQAEAPKDGLAAKAQAAASRYWHRGVSENRDNRGPLV